MCCQQISFDFAVFLVETSLKTTLLMHDTTISLWRLKIDSNHEKNLYQQL